MTDAHEQQDQALEPEDGVENDKDKPRTVVVVGPDGQPVGTVQVDPDDAEDAEDPAKLVEQPAKVMRVGNMVKQLLEEVRAAPLDDAGRRRLKAIHAKSIAELEDGLAPELRDELERLSLPFGEDETPTESELRIAQAQLVGWLEGLFHGIQAALVAQQMAARMQLEQMRRNMPALPGGPAAQMPGGLQAALRAAGGNSDEESGTGTGQYL